MVAETPDKYEPSSDESIRQAEIITGLIQYKRIVGTNPIEFARVTHPFAISMTQDCDLRWDFDFRFNEGKAHQEVPSVLFCEMTPAVDARAMHNSAMWKNVRQNKNERYQFLEAVPPDFDSANEGLVELALDFKRYFTIPTEDVYDQCQEDVRRRCRIKSPYLEHLCSRFAYFQNRVALPSDHESEPMAQNR